MKRLIKHLFAAGVALHALAFVGCGANTRQTPARTTTTNADVPTTPGSTAPASPAESWTTEGGPANPGAPSSGSTTDPSIEDAHDGGVW